MHKYKYRFKIEERRKTVASLLAQSLNETEIAQMLGVDQSTISRDISALKKSSLQHIYDMAKTDLPFYYKRCLDGIGEVKRHAWEMIRSESLIPKDKLLALRLIMECDESMFSLFQNGPSVLSVHLLEARLKKIESQDVGQAFT
jgi:DNA-binding transcriptional ArsR family regulator